MKRRLKALLMALVMMVTTVISLNGNYVSAKADDADGITVVFHFTGTKDNSYSDYRLWLWTIGDGYEAHMTDNGTEATYTLKENSATLQVGFIVKKGDGWDAKDYDSDRFIDLTSIVSGQVDVYLTSGVGAYQTDDSKAVKGVKLTSASSTDLATITIKSSAKIPVSASELTSYFKLKDTTNDVYVDVTSVEVVEENETTGNYEYLLTPGQKLDAMGSYEIEYGDGFKFMVGLPDYYASEEFESKYTYTGDDLGATYTSESTTFRVWAPLATRVWVNLYTTGDDSQEGAAKIGVSEMTADVNGTWVVTISGDLKNFYYTYSAIVNGVEKETIDPYARTAGVNGKRGMIIDLDATDPEGWENDKNPCTTTHYEDAVIYELHVRDFSYDASSGMVNKGKYLAFTETGTVNSFGQSTGIDYLKDLGVTHIQLMPVYDYSSVDESNLEKDQFNWGYDPQNYNFPEGSYSTDPYNGATRVNEFKQMVQSLHNAGISVVMDVVYGHVSSSDSFSVNMLTPSYYTRTASNGSGCGNDTATERAMNRKFIVDSMIYWATEYHIDGFRIDQVGLFDTDTVNEVTEALHAIDPNIILYGEGWAMTTNPSKDVDLATQANADITPGFGYFNDGIRDALKGGVFALAEAGYATRNFDKLGSVLDNVTAGAAWAASPNQVIQYNSCHDNYTLFDKICITNADDSFEDRVKENNLAAAIVYTAQGVPLMQAGEELLRSKPLDEPNSEGVMFEHNSYASSSAMNAIKWDDLNKEEYAKTYEYYKGLIEFRKNHAALRMTSYEDILANLKFIQKGNADDDCVIVYELNGGANGEVSDGITVIYNPSLNTKTIDLSEGEWKICINGEKAGTEVLGTATGSVEVAPISTMVLVKGKTVDDGTVGNGDKPADSGNNGNNQNGDGLAPNQGVKTGDNATAYAIIVLMVIACAGVFVVARKRKTN